MKNNLIKSTLVLLLCLIFFTGCVITPTPEESPTPTPIEPTPTPVPYGEVIDVTIQINDEFNWSLAKLLLEKFSLKLTEYTSSTIGGSDIILTFRAFPYSSEEPSVRNDSGWMAKKVGGINYLEYLDDMPNYSSLFYTKESFCGLFNYETYMYSLPKTGEKEYKKHYLWLYNEKWFEKYNYSIPETMEELVDLLIDHKTNVDPSAQPILINTQNGKYPTIMDTTLPHGVFTTYGIDYFNELKKDYDKGVFNYSTSDPKVIEALNILKKINDNSLASDSSINYEDVLNSDFSECAVFYDAHGSVTGTISYGNIRDVSGEGFNWKIFETQLSYNGTPYVVNPSALNAQNNYGLINQLIIHKDANEEVKTRLFDYIDWCSTNEGILAAYFGIEGEDYRLDENGKLVLLKDINKISPAAMQVVSDSYALYTIYDKYGYSIEPYYTRDIERLTYIDSGNIKLLTQPEINYATHGIVRDAYKNLVTVSEQFFNDYVNGTKTADDFEDYIADLEEAGLSDFLEDAKEYYEELYEEFKDYLPDSLK